ncbi:MAG: class F sortase [Candidatus Nomurabacteria bacterium]|nr:class F sortase [Candidatus Nomurabacteria bacterium]
MKLIKKLLEKKLLTITIIGFIFSAWAISYFIFQNYYQDNPIASASQEKTNFDLSANESPIRLKIPVINVDSIIEYVGIDKDGTMGVPQGPSNVAWYNLGPRPGEVGSAVIAGHSGWKDGIPAAFDNLYKVSIGDKIYVEDNLGVTNTFIVRAMKTYNPNEDAFIVFNSSDNKAHLNLITCSGLWDKIEKDHSSRLVIFTDKE